MNSQGFRHISLEERAALSKRVTAKNSEQGTVKNRKPIMKIIDTVSLIVTVIFALVGVGFLAVYFSVNLHLTNSKGIIDEQSESFWNNGKSNIASAIAATDDKTDTFFTASNYCKMRGLKSNYPGTFYRILKLAYDDQKELANNNLQVAINISNQGQQDTSPCEIQSNNMSKRDFEILADMVDHENLFLFASSTEWAFFKSAAIKDATVIKKVENETGIKARILVSALVAEQMRLFYSSRAWFEHAISPVKILASMSQFSWGVMGIKEETASKIEYYLKNKNTNFYPGSDYENMLDFDTADISQERFNRITNSKDHYYAYLYAALFEKEIISQWQKSGYDISNRPEILATIYNIGFAHSTPNSNPQTGGAELNIDGKIISFGKVAYDFYYSGELLDEFPQ